MSGFLQIIMNSTEDYLSTLKIFFNYISWSYVFFLKFKEFSAKMMFFWIYAGRIFVYKGKLTVVYIQHQDVVDYVDIIFHRLKIWYVTFVVFKKFCKAYLFYLPAQTVYCIFTVSVLTGEGERIWRWEFSNFPFSWSFRGILNFHIVAKSRSGNKLYIMGWRSCWESICFWWRNEGYEISCTNNVWKYDLWLVFTEW